MKEKNKREDNPIEIVDAENNTLGLPLLPKPMKVLLVVENLDSSFGKKRKYISKSPKEISNEEKILLTSVAHIIVEILLKEDL
ncbi:hypothetical protein [Pedobacter aquatilis]|uniref:hypothetical protein n=1 Tax=Pedobacter aquatilis TaxID=351343 RepID=UPI00292E8908|nr:hypothetical protein [Pedobacter aquatilis]